MNDHISKPIDPALLFKTVGQFLQAGGRISPFGPGRGPESKRPGTAPAKPPVAKSQDLPSFEGLDTKDGLTRVAGNQKLYLKLLRQFGSNRDLRLSR